MKPQKLSTRLLVSISLILSGSVHASALSETANSLQPGESVKLKTSLPGSLLTPEVADFLMWSSSGVWDPTRGEVRFIGKRYSIFPYHFLVYDEATNSWTANRPLHPDLQSPQNGHGYDHNTVDPTTGTHYFQQFNSPRIYAWNDGLWSVVTLPASYIAIGSISWVPGKGLVYSDSSNFEYYDGSAWHDINGGVAGGMTSYHTVSEYNSTSNVMIMGGGNGGSEMWKYDIASDKVSQIASPPINLGASSSEGVLVSDPVSDHFIGWMKVSTQWVAYEVSTDKWAPLTESSGDGSSAQMGTPDLSASSEGGSTIGIPISTYGVMMFVQFRGSSSDADVWLYKHSDSVEVGAPMPPADLSTN